MRERYQCCQHQVLDIAFIHSTGHHQPVVGIRFHLSHLGSSLSLFLQSSPCFQPWMAPTRDSRDGSQEYEHTIQQGHTATLGGTQNLSKGQQTDTNSSILHQKVMLQTNERGLLPVRIAFIRIPLPLFISMTVYVSLTHGPFAKIPDSAPILPQQKEPRREVHRK